MPLYSTTDTDSCLLDHDLKSLALYDTDGSDIPIAVAEEVAESFESILSDVWDEAASNREWFQFVRVMVPVRVIRPFFDV